MRGVLPNITLVNRSGAGDDGPAFVTVIEDEDGSYMVVCMFTTPHAADAFRKRLPGSVGREWVMRLLEHEELARWLPEWQRRGWKISVDLPSPEEHQRICALPELLLES